MSRREFKVWIFEDGEKTARTIVGHDWFLACDAARLFFLDLLEGGAYWIDRCIDRDAVKVCVRNEVDLVSTFWVRATTHVRLCMTT